jgi:hypothetical protein
MDHRMPFEEPFESPGDDPINFCLGEAFGECIQEGEAVNNIAERTRFYDEDLMGIHQYEFLLLRVPERCAAISPKNPRLLLPKQVRDRNDSLFA